MQLITRVPISTLINVYSSLRKRNYLKINCNLPLKSKYGYRKDFIINRIFLVDIKLFQWHQLKAILKLRMFVLNVLGKRDCLCSYSSNSVIAFQFLTYLNYYIVRLAFIHIIYFHISVYWIRMVFEEKKTGQS